MNQEQDLGSFIKENKKLASEYLETRIELFRLQAVKSVSKAMGLFIWLLISALLLLLLSIFACLLLSFWLADLTGSTVAGFGITTLILAVLVLLLAIFRKKLFVNPVIRKVIRKLQEDSADSTN